MTKPVVLGPLTVVGLIGALHDASLVYAESLFARSPLIARSPRGPQSARGIGNMHEGRGLAPRPATTVVGRGPPHVANVASKRFPNPGRIPPNCAFGDREPLGRLTGQRPRITRRTSERPDGFM